MTELVAVKNDSTGNVIQNYNDVQNVAKAMVQSGYFTDSKSLSQAVVKILAGREIGVGPFASMNGIHIIKGKPAFSANMMADRLKSSGRYNYRVTEMNEKVCTIDFYEFFNGKWEKSGTSSFSFEDAKKAGTQNLDKFPRNMLFARAMSNGVKWYCPDVMSGSTVYTPEELGAVVDGEGDVINLTPIRPNPEPEQTEPDDVIEGEIIEPQNPAEGEKQAQNQVLEANANNSSNYPMTLEEACKITTDAGVLYGEQPKAVLERMLVAMTKKLEANGLSALDRAEITRKIAAAKIIITAKKDGSMR